MKMKTMLVIGLALCSTLVSADEQWQQVEYVKICSVAGPGYFYIPGTDVCLNPSTGITLRQTENGFVYGQSQMAQKISNLEAEIKVLEEALNLYYPQS